jgi:hypothetical protein
MKLTEENSDGLWNQFDDFHDAVIRVVELRPETSSASVDIDAEDVSETRWYRVRFEFDGVREWVFEQTRSDMVVIYAARVARVDDLTFVGFDAATMPARPSADDFRGSTAFAAGENVTVTTSPL